MLQWRQMVRTEGQWRGGDILSVQIDPAVYAANQLIGQLIEANISSQVSRALTRLQAKLEGIRDHEWIEMRSSGGEPINQATAINFIGELIYHGCMCADGNHKLAEERKQEFLGHPEKVMSMLNLSL